MSKLPGEKSSGNLTLLITNPIPLIVSVLYQIIYLLLREGGRGGEGGERRGYSKLSHEAAQKFHDL